MGDLILEASTKTPEICFGYTSGILEIKGRSIPEISSEFYNQLVDWVQQYGVTPQPETIVNAKLEYFNTSSSKSLLDVFKKLEEIHLSGKSKVKINWYFIEDDESMQEAGEEYKILLEVPFEILSAESF